MIYSFTYYWNAEVDAKGRNVGFFGYEPTHRLEVAYQGFIFSDQPAIFAELVERLFYVFDVAHPSDYRGPSMSVGSVVAINCQAYKCASTGFEKVDLTNNSISACPTGWHGLAYLGRRVLHL